MQKKTIGMLITGRNQDLTGESIKESRVKRGQLREIKVFINNGKEDKISTPVVCYD